MNAVTQELYQYPVEDYIRRATQAKAAIDSRDQDIKSLTDSDQFIRATEVSIACFGIENQVKALEKYTEPGKETSPCSLIMAELSKQLAFYQSVQKPPMTVMEQLLVAKETIKDANGKGIVEEGGLPWANLTAAEDVYLRRVYVAEVTAEVTAATEEMNKTLCTFQTNPLVQKYLGKDAFETLLMKMKREVAEFEKLTTISKTSENKPIASLDLEELQQWRQEVANQAEALRSTFAEEYPVDEFLAELQRYDDMIDELPERFEAAGKAPQPAPVRDVVAFADQQMKELSGGGNNLRSILDEIVEPMFEPLSEKIRDAKFMSAEEQLKELSLNFYC